MLKHMVAFLLQPHENLSLSDSKFCVGRYLVSAQIILPSYRKDP